MLINLFQTFLYNTKDVIIEFSQKYRSMLTLQAL